MATETAVSDKHPLWRLRLPKAARRALPRLGAAATALCAIAVLWAGIALAIKNVRSEALAGATLNAENLARALEENVAQTVKAADQVLLSVRRSFGRDPAGFDIAEWAETTQAITELTPELALTDRSGTVITGIDMPQRARKDLSDREHFQVLRDTPGDTLFIGKPTTGRASGKTVLILARKLLGADGSFDGIVFLSLDAAYLTRFYRSMALGSGSVVELVGTDGVVRARDTGVEPDGAGAAQRAKLSPDFAKARHRASAGSYVANSVTDGIRRIYAYRQTAAYPLIVVVGVAEAEALRRYRIVRDEAILFGVLGTTLIAAVLGAHMRHASNLVRVRDELHEKYTRKSGLLETTLDHMSEGLVVFGADRRIQLFNQRVLETFRVPHALLAGEPMAADVLRVLWDRGEFAAAGPDFDRWLDRFIPSETDSGALRTYEHIRPDGTVVEVRSRALPEGGFVRTYTDITQHKRDQQILRDARDEATRATRAKSAFLATMSHEIRSPLSGLLGVLDLLRATALDGEQARMAEMIHSSGQMLLAVLNDVLDFSKIEAGALSIAPAPTDLRRLLAELVAPLVAAGQQRGLAVTLAIAPAVPAWLTADPLRIRQIVGNLLSNAMKFTVSGTVAVTVDIAPGGGALGTDAAAGTLRVAVCDTGIGMDAAVLGRLFQPFVQADSTTTRRYGGSGLGLSIALQLARLQGGTMSATSTPGAGSTFTLDLPCRPCPPPDEAPSPPAPAPASRVGEGARALLVDDDTTNRWLIRRQLQTLGFAVDIAEDGQAGLAAAEAAPYDLVVTDLHMPQMDGVALTRAIRSAPDLRLRAVPVIGLTADTTAMQRERCEQAGMTELAIKPLTAGRLAALLGRIMQGVHAGGTTAPAP